MERGPRTELVVAGLDGTPRTVSAGQLDALVRALRGNVARPGDPDYREATRIWNGMIRRRPALVVRAKDAQDVRRTVEFCAEHGLELSVKGGGHNIAGLALSDGGITLDLSAMRFVDLDLDTGLAAVGPGCTLGDVDRVTQRHGLATTLGFVSQTGAGGLTLGGGFGYLTRRFGWTVDSLDQVEIVTADGLLRHASHLQSEDLFWALRGGGGNFGVVTEFAYRLHRVGPQVTAGLIAWPAADAGAVLRLFRETTATAPRELTVAAVMRNAPPAPWVPVALRGSPIIALLVCHTGSAAQAEHDLRPIRAHGQPLADAIQVKGYAEQQSMMDATQPAGLHYYWKSEFLPRLDDAVFDTCEAMMAHNSSPSNQIVLFHIGGELNDHPPDDGAVGNRDAAYACIVQASWPELDPADDEYRMWVRQAWSAIRPYSTGGNYVNFQSDDEGDDRTQEAYRDTYRRLATVKARYDPTNLFRVNRNIQPDAGDLGTISSSGAVGLVDV
jgi:FAD/FMN-containing dehydrogenase